MIMFRIAVSSGLPLLLTWHGLYMWDPRRSNGVYTLCLDCSTVFQYRRCVPMRKGCTGGSSSGQRAEKGSSLQVVKYLTFSYTYIDCCGIRLGFESVLKSSLELP